MSADFVIEDWPTSGGSSSISGELEWPEPSHYRTVSGEIPYSHPGSEILTASVSGHYLDINNKLYEKSNYVGLRGVFKIISVNQQMDKWEDVRSLRRYVLWRWAGYAPGEAGLSPADIEEIEALDKEFKNTAAGEAAEQNLTGREWMYFYDGVSKDSLGNPVMTLYYQDGQGLQSNNEGKVNIDFYEMRPTGAALQKAGEGYDGSETFSGVGSAKHASEAFDTTTSFEHGAGGAAATETAYQTVYADVLAWNRLSGGSTNEMHLEPLLSFYKTIRENMMSTAGSVLEDSLGVIGGQFMHPDKSQAIIRQNIESRLREDYSDAWVDFFMTKENVSTITPEGFKEFKWDQDARSIPAGTPPEQIQGRNAPMNNASSYIGLGGGSVVALENVTVVGPYFHLSTFGHLALSEFGSVEHDNAKLVQIYPQGYNASGYSSRTLSHALESIDEFIFPYTPNEIQYQGLGAKWVEVPRTGDLPLLEFSQWTLMKVSMEFVVANMEVTSGRIYPDGLKTSIYDQLEQLRTMAQRPFPVSIFGLDQLLRVSMKRAELTGKPLEFVIGDMSVSSLQRTIQGGNKEITSARVKMTLQEIPIEDSIIHHFRLPIVVPNITPPDGDVGGDGYVTAVADAGGAHDIHAGHENEVLTYTRTAAEVLAVNAPRGAHDRTTDTYPEYDEWGIYGDG